MTKKTVCVDFDGVIHKYSKGWQDGSIYDEPVEGAKEYLERLCKEYKVIIFTTRINPYPFGVLDADRLLKTRDDAIPKINVLKWLEKNGFENNKHFHGIRCQKPAAVAYIDDRAVNFKQWDDDLLESVKNIKK